MVALQNATSLIPKTSYTHDMSGTFFLVTVLTWVFFLALGISNRKYAAVYAFGAIVGLILFGSAVATAYPQAFVEAIIEAVLVIVGIILSLAINARSTPW